MSRRWFLLIPLFVLQLFSCKKDAQHKQAGQTNTSLEAGLKTFSVNGQLGNAIIDTTENTITVVIPSSVAKTSLKANFTLADGVNATINNVAVNGGTVFDFSNTVTFTVTSANKQRATSFNLTVQTDLEYFGLGGSISAQKSLNRTYNFYFDQMDGSAWQANNCAPTLATMVLKYFDSTFTKTPADARKEIRPGGGNWSLDDMHNYMLEHGINSTTDTLSNVDSLIKRNIDEGNLVILNLNMGYVPVNFKLYQHVQKFYTTPGGESGHVILAKGYKKIGNTFYVEVYDPFSDGQRYDAIGGNQLKGKDRYYTSAAIRAATINWYSYAIVVNGGQKVTGSLKLKTNRL